MKLKGIINDLNESRERRDDYAAIILEPVNTNPLSAVREKMDALGLTEKDVQEAVTWSRKRK